MFMMRALLTLCMLGIFSCFSCLLQTNFFPKNSFKNTIRVFWVPGGSWIWVKTVYKSHISAEDKKSPLAGKELSRVPP